MDNADGLVHPVIEPYVFPVSPYEAFTSVRRNDVPLLIGSNTEEARAMVDISHEAAAGFSSDLGRSAGQLPPALVAAYPHATDAEAKQARLDLERDLRFGWDMWPRRHCKPELRRVASTTRFASSHRSWLAPCMRAGARAISPNSGMSLTIWTKSRGDGPRQIEEWLRRCRAIG